MKGRLTLTPAHAVLPEAKERILQIRAEPAFISYSRSAANSFSFVRTLFIRLAVEDGEPLLYCKKEGAASQQLYAV